MTYILPGISPARLRIEAAGRAFQEAKAREAAQSAEAVAAAIRARVIEAQRAWRQAIEDRRRQAVGRLEAILSRGRIGISCSSLASAVAQKHGLTIADLCGVDRKQSVNLVRQEAMYLLRKAGKSTVVIGRFFNRDHTTVMYACRKYEQRLANMEKARAMEAAHGAHSFDQA